MLTIGEQRVLCQIEKGLRAGDREFAWRLALFQGALRWAAPGRQGCLLAAAVLAAALLTFVAATGRLLAEAAQNWGALALEPSAAPLLPW